MREKRIEKPVVIVRKKAGAKRAPTGPNHAPPRATVPPPPVKPTLTPPSSPASLPAARSQPPAAPAPIGPDPTARARQARYDLLDVFHNRWPLAFPREYRQVRPLALGIHR